MKELDTDIKVECFEEYFGEKDEMLKKIDACQSCGSKLMLSHLPDYKNLVIQETARCIECGKVIRKMMSSIH